MPPPLSVVVKNANIINLLLRVLWFTGWMIANIFDAMHFEVLVLLLFVLCCLISIGCMCFSKVPFFRSLELLISLNLPCAFLY